MGKPNIEKVKQIQEKGKAWMANYKKFDLSSDSEAAKQYKEMTLVLDKCSQILEKESKKSVSKDEIGSIPIDSNRFQPIDSIFYLFEDDCNPI